MRVVFIRMAPEVVVCETIKDDPYNSAVFTSVLLEIADVTLFVHVCVGGHLERWHHHDRTGRHESSLPRDEPNESAPEDCQKGIAYCRYSQQMVGGRGSGCGLWVWHSKILYCIYRSTHFNNMLALCLMKSPSGRPSAAQLLEHPFIADVSDNKPLRILYQASF